MEKVYLLFPSLLRIKPTRWMAGRQARRRASERRDVCMHNLIIRKSYSPCIHIRWWLHKTSNLYCNSRVDVSIADLRTHYPLFTFRVNQFMPFFVVTMMLEINTQIGHEGLCVKFSLLLILGRIALWELSVNDYCNTIKQFHRCHPSKFGLHNQLN